LTAAAWRLLRALVHGLHGVVIVVAVFPRLARGQREARIAWWSAKMLRCLGIRLATEGRFVPGPVLIAANHLSWLDIMAIHASCPQARFVSKAEVQGWPVVRRLVDAARTLYLERGRRRDALRVLGLLKAALAEGDTVAVFPEGTTGDGRALLPFHGNLLQAAIDVGAPVQPVALRFSDPQHPVMSPAALFVGDTTLAQSLWRLASGRGLVVRVAALPPLPTLHADRRALADRVRSEIAAALSLAAPTPAPAERRPDAAPVGDLSR
jgi:1-acyl-sn-glycerol-3-phosphate acyltransferase